MAFEWVKNLVPAVEMTEGPYYGRGGPDRSDIRDGLPGVDFLLAIKVVDAASSEPVQGLKVDIWHCNAQGYYSGYEFDPDLQPLSVQYQMPTNTETYLRGSQITDAGGIATFLTIFPGWYATRTPHIHVKVFKEDACILTTQLYLPEESLNRLYANHAAYFRSIERDTRNNTDIVLARTSGSIDGCWVELCGTANGFQGESLLAVDLQARSVRREIPPEFRPPLGGIPHNKRVR